MKYAKAAVDFWGLGRGDRVLQLAEFGFDVAIDQILTTLLAGATVVLRGPDPLTPRALTQFICDKQISVVHLAPLYWQSWVEGLCKEDAQSIPSLRLVQVGGDIMPPAAVKLWLQLGWTDVRVFNRYGPTETTMFTTAYEVTQAAAGLKRIPIGQAIGPRFLKLLDGKGKAVPRGEIGEIHIGGETLALGYFNSPDLTAARFIPDPYSQVPGCLLYKTGDLGRLLPDDNIEFLGRSDFQVQIRSYRIELGDVEAAIGEHQNVSACGVVAQFDDNENQTLTGYVVLKSGTHLSTSELHRWLRTKLPDYMIPDRHMEIPSLPTSRSGKLDRTKLASIPFESMKLDSEHLAPRDEIESRLTEIWLAILRMSQIGIRDNFFEVGGHSLLAAIICSEISTRLGIDIPLRLFFDNPTIELLANECRKIAIERSPSTVISKASRKETIPASFSQEGMWFLREILPDPAIYNEPIAFAYSGDLNTSKLRYAMQFMMDRHEILRTTLKWNGTLIFQHIHHPGVKPVPFREITMGADSTCTAEPLLDELMMEEARRPFDLASDPAWRALLIHKSQTEHVIVFTSHHGIVDEWSWRLFFEELENIFCGEPPQTLDLQMADYAAWQRKEHDNECFSGQKRFWGTQLFRLPAKLELQRDLHPCEKTTSGGNVLKLNIPVQARARFRALALKMQTSLFTTLLAAFQVWLHKETGHKDIVVGTPFSNRQKPETQRMLGFFLNTLPIRTLITPEKSFTDLLAEVRETILSAFENADLPFAKIVEAVSPARAKTQTPIFQVMFVLVEQSVSPPNLDGLVGTKLPIHTGTAKNDLTLFIEAGQDEWNCIIEYSTDLFSPHKASEMARSIELLFDSLALHSQTPLCQISKITDCATEEKNRGEIHNPPEFLREKSISALFEEQVKLAPDAIALEFGDTIITYHELNNRAFNLAAKLVAAGVGAGTLVGIQCQRSVEMIVGLLGILKAGAAYLALNPSDPPARTRRILNNARPTAMLTQGMPDQLEFEGAIIDLRRVSEKPIASEPLPQNNATGEDLAYVCYTSGSTGDPKGVMIPHRGISRLVLHTNYIDISRSDVFLQLAPLSFDASTFEIWGALLNGAKLVIHPPENPSFHELADFIRNKRITTLWLTAALFHQMVDLEIESLLGVPRLLAGGEVLSVAHVKKFLGRIRPGHVLINGYGPTENTTFTTFHRMDASSKIDTRVPIGIPVANTTVKILDKSGNPANIGICGEILIGGAGLALGYLNDTALDKEKFISDPNLKSPHERLYRSGDLGSWREDGSIDFLGRIDDQVKLRGFRIELGEIESALRDVPGIRDAAVTLQPRGSQDHTIIAFIVPTGDGTPTESRVKDQLRTTLPEYMVPVSLHSLKAMPLTPNGKIDRNALSELTANIDISAREMPRDLLEYQIAEIWRELFSREDIGRNDNFFNLGGHSLLALVLAKKLEELEGRQLPIRTLFQAQTIAELAELLEREDWIPAWSSLVPLKPNGTKPPLFLIHGWGGEVFAFLELARKMNPDRPVYGIQATDLDTRGTPYISVEEMATYYANEIRSFQAEGPYHLCGHSLGGWIAYAVAQELKKQGCCVGFLGLLDTRATANVHFLIHAAMIAPNLIWRTFFHLRRFAKTPASERTAYISGRINAFYNHLARPQNKTQKGATHEHPANEKNSSDRFYLAHAQYKPPRYSGDIDVFIANETPWVLKSFWIFMSARHCRFHKVPGTHRSMLSTENAAETARILDAALQSASSKGHRLL